MSAARTQPLTWSIIDTPVGAVIGVATAKGLCRVLVGANQRAVTREFRAAYPDAELIRDDAAMRSSMRALAAITRGKSAAQIVTDVDGTPFQESVWRALNRIPKGQTRSYGEIAKAIRQPKAARAVASACASNPIALVVPCHRVIHADGTVSGYAWGVDVKRALLDVEGSHYRG